MTTFQVEAQPEHTAFRDALVAVIQEHQHLTPIEMLAIASQFVGQLIALQDQRVVTSAIALELVGRNIEIGNQGVITDFVENTAGAA